ncbi:MAG: alginate lyase family protein [Eubacteriales bacterium]
MADMKWLINRLKSMSVQEIGWRVSQKIIEKQEEQSYKNTKIKVIDKILYDKLKNLHLDHEKLHLNIMNTNYGLHSSIPLLGDYEYETYKMNWHAGFQTDSEWPMIFSYSLEYKQRDDIGDARTNWELNRHFQFPILAKNYAITKDEKYLLEFQELFYDWNEKNPFLWGISWTSVMEVAIRCSNWCYAYCFLVSTDDKPHELLKDIEIGILNMTQYVANHYSRYSSANNHLIVEAYAIGQSGILFDKKDWIDLSRDILTRELSIQNYSDGINKELSLHYQSFYMEAMALMMRLYLKNEVEVPSVWYSMLDKMCRYVRNCMGNYGEIIEFGDNDEGKILDLSGVNHCHYTYVLDLLGCMLGNRYTEINNSTETVSWLFTKDETDKAKVKTLYAPKESICYEEGGNTILRSEDGRVLVGIDHAELGFGSIAAHGHADALSFQMFVDGKPVFIDSGTYIYHCDLESRNAYRKTENHNTVCIGGKDQSEMLGAFLWGKRATCKVVNSQFDNTCDILEIEHDGYDSDNHKRKFIFDRVGNSLIIIDEIITKQNSTLNYIFDSNLETEIIDSKVFLKSDGMQVTLELKSNEKYTLEKTIKKQSRKYGCEVDTIGAQVNGCINIFETRINIQ